jgi:RHH-type proline utilization regulon transcriptional repressor/proline dehydrogenase/delta 1-pyrroline-5-carboxylate dehydrogenase
MLTGRMVDLGADVTRDAGGWLRGFTRRAGEPLVRQALRRAMKIIGSEFVVGRTIEEALDRSAREEDLALCSYDMLGEGARTEADALRYLAAYAGAIDRIGTRAAGRPLHHAPAISIKLSALDPRYSLSHRDSVLARLVPRVQGLARQAASYGIGLTVDAEEADRLDLSLDIMDALIRDSATRDWAGLGLAVQAYGKRAPEVIDWIAATARDAGRRMTLRLVKGAYWDTEIKRAQERGLDGYPVYTRKSSTDLAYLACAARLFKATDVIHSQFATHNAHTIAALLTMRPAEASLEFQRLHGMGRLLYAEAARQVRDFPRVRVYAPVGEHADLLAYLVRRLLENGANTSFVNRFMDEAVPVVDVVQDPLTLTESLESLPHPRIPLPAKLYGAERANSRGFDFGDPDAVRALLAELAALRPRQYTAGPLIGGELRGRADVKVTSPTDRRRQVGLTRDATPAEITEAFDRAHGAQRDWDARGGADRAACLDRAADLFEARRLEFMSLLVREAGKTPVDAVAEVRETVDFCRYYAARAREQFGVPQRLPGPTGESNELSLHGRGVFACLSPWNFPLAIFTGQVAAALAAGNAVIAKPAAPTTVIGLLAVQVLHEAGVPVDVLHLVPAEGPAFGNVAFRHPALAGVALTGSTATAQKINRLLAERDGPIVPLIAETGGLNAMVVDSTALPEQVVDDVVASAFTSAGQRCSALRLLFLQEDIADRVLEMLIGAMDELVVGDPAELVTDVGPVITETAAQGLRQHVERMRREARVLKVCRLPDEHSHGVFVPPTLIELENAGQLTREEFGPILHVVRYKAAAFDSALAAIRASGFGLTLGVQTRLDSTWRQVYEGTAVGNTYVNRNMIGAVVGVQPFGGQGLSGTGPKAGGPHYLQRFATEKTLTINTVATGGNAALLTLD